MQARTGHVPTGLDSVSTQPKHHSSWVVEHDCISVIYCCGQSIGRMSTGELRAWSLRVDEFLENPCCVWWVMRTHQGGLLERGEFRRRRNYFDAHLVMGHFGRQHKVLAAFLSCSSFGIVWFVEIHFLWMPFFQKISEVLPFSNSMRMKMDATKTGESCIIQAAGPCALFVYVHHRLYLLRGLSRRLATAGHHPTYNNFHFVSQGTAL